MAGIGPSKVEAGVVKKRSRGRRRPVGRRIVCCVCGIVGLAIAIAPSRHIWRLYQERAALQKELAAMEAQRLILERQVSHMGSEQWVEQAAREQLGLVKPGEIVYIPIVDSEH